MAPAVRPSRCRPRPRAPRASTPSRPARPAWPGRLPGCHRRCLGRLLEPRGAGRRRLFQPADRPDLGKGHNRATTRPTCSAAAGSGTLLRLARRPFGLSYYRLRRPGCDPTPRRFRRRASPRRSSPIKPGVTLVHSLTDGIAVGATGKLVRGIATSYRAGARRCNVDDLLDEADDLVGEAATRSTPTSASRSSTATLRAGLTVRNLANPSFESAGGGPG